MNRTAPPKAPYTVAEAAEASPTLASLAALARDSAKRLESIQPLVPAALARTLKAGPIEGDTWCLLVEGSAAAAKIRQLLPAFAAHLRSRGWQVNSIRLKLQSGRR